MNKEMPEIDVTSEKPVTKKNKNMDYIRYILAAICLTLAAILYVIDINKKQENNVNQQAIQADLNYIRSLVSGTNKINSVHMIIDIENDSMVNIMIPCSEAETMAITEALAKAETTDFLKEQRDGKLFTIFLNCNNNARFCIEAAVIDEDPSNAYVRAKKPVKVSGDKEKQEITWEYTVPAVIKGFGDYLNKLYTEKLPEIKRQSEFFQYALEKDENTKKLLEENGTGKLILTPASKEQTELITKQMEALKAKHEEEAEIPAVEAPAVEAPAVEQDL